MKTKLITALFFLLSYTAFAQCKIIGVISNSDKKTLSSANVYLPELNKGAVSGVDGSFSIGHLPEGSFIIQVSHISYGTYIGKLVLHQGDNRVDISLQSSIIETSETVISGGAYANQHESALKIDIIRPGDINTASAASPSEILTRVPGVDMISKGQGISKPSIRGLAMNNILILENGFRVENYQYSDHHPLGIDDHGAGSIEVIKGPASLIYGSDAMGGVINFLSEAPAPVGKIGGEYETKFFSSSLGLDHSLMVQGSKEKWQAGIRLSQRNHADYLQGEGDFVPNTRFHENYLKANLGISARRSVHRLFISLGDMSYGISEHEAEDLIKDRGRKMEYFYQDMASWSIANSNRFFWGDTKIELNAAARNGSLLHAEDADAVEIEMRLFTYSLEGKAQLPLNKNTKMLAGIQGFHQNNLNVNAREVILLPDAMILDLSGFLLLEYNPVKRLHLQAGLRGDQRMIETLTIGDSMTATYRPALDLSYRSPGMAIGGTFEVSKHWLIRANLASSHRNPTLAELSSNGLHELRYEIGDALLKPQRAIQLDLSSHVHRQNMTLDLALYNSAISGYIFIAPDGDTTSEGYGIYRYWQKDARIRGGELALHYHPISLPWLHFSGDLSIVEGTISSGGYLPYIPAMKANLELMVKSKGNSTWTSPYFILHLHHAAAQNNPSEEEDSSNAYSLINLGAGTELPFISNGFSIRFGVNNLFDRKYVDHLSLLRESGFFNPGRNFFVSISLPFGSN